MTISLETAIKLIEEKRQQEEQRHLKQFSEDAKLEVLNGRYGPYIAYDSRSEYRRICIHMAAALTYEQCMGNSERHTGNDHGAAQQPERMTRIILTGYMGAGKTTIGHALAKVLGVPFTTSTGTLKAGCARP